MRKELILLAAFFQILAARCLALNVDSLGGSPWTWYLRGSGADTAAGPLWLNDIRWLYAEAQAGRQLMQWKNYGGGILGWNFSATSPMLYGVNASNGNPWLELRQDSSGPGLIKLHGNSAQTNSSDILLIDQLGNNSRGISVYAGQGTGIYVGYNGPGTAVKVTNNNASSGVALKVDNMNTGTGLYISDTKNGRVVVISQDSLNKPSITAGYKYGPTFRDSAMLYPWGLRSKKVVADTLWGRFVGTSDSSVIAGRANHLRTGAEYQSGDKFLRTDKIDTARFVVFDSIKAGKIVDLNVAVSTNANYLLYGSAYHSGTSYLRSDAADTANGLLWLNDVRYLQSYNPVGGGYSQIWNNYGNQSVLAYNYNPVGQGIYAINKGVNDGQSPPYRSSYWLDMRSDSTGGMIRLDCNSSAVEGMRVLGVRRDNMGIAIYNDHGGDQYGVRIENNYMSTGTGLWIDNQNTGTALYISDTKSGRMIVTSQDSANKPAITVGYKYGPAFKDSAMLYYWGLKGRKVKADTVYTALSGRRYFGNQQKNLCDTILAWGVAESTTVVTVSYGRDNSATSWNGLQAWAGRDTIYVQRRTLSDPVCYYWRAEKVVNPSQIQAGQDHSGPGLPPDPRATGSLTVRLEQSFPNPSPDAAIISYQTTMAGQVNLTVYNMAGQRVRTLVDCRQPAGSYSVQWKGDNDQGQNVSAGVYLYKLKAEGLQQTRKMVLIK